MPTKISIALGDHFEGFITRQLESGRYSSASDVICAGLHLLEESEQRIAGLVQAVIEGKDRGVTCELDMQAIKRKARRKMQSHRRGRRPLRRA
jgi:antitoxin ParD1/3/4